MQIEPINEGPATAIHLETSNDMNGNPRRFWLVMSAPPESYVLAAVDEGYAGAAGLYALFPAVEIVAEILVPTSEFYRWRDKPCWVPS